MVLALLLVLAASPVEASQQRLANELKRELDRKSMTLAVGGPNELVLRLTPDVFERVDPLWKALGAVLEEAQRRGAPTFRVELAPHEHCVKHRDLARHYLFDKRRADASRVVVWGRCGPDAPDEPASQQLGALTVEARRFMVREDAGLESVALHVSNSSDAGVELTIDGLDLFSPGDPVQVRVVPISSVWFEQEGQPSVKVRERLISVPAAAAVQVRLQFDPSLDLSTSHSRVRVSSKGARAVVVGPVSR